MSEYDKATASYHEVAEDGTRIALLVVSAPENLAGVLMHCV